MSMVKANMHKLSFDVTPSILVSFRLVYVGVHGCRSSRSDIANVAIA